MFWISNGSRIHIMAAASMSIVYALLFAFLKPTKHASDNVVQLTSLTATFVNFSLAALLRISKESSEDAFSDDIQEEAIVSNFLIATNALILILINWYSFRLLYPNIKAWFLNPRFSLECCLATFVSFTDVTSNFTDSSPVANIELPSIQDTLNDQLTLDIEGFEYTEDMDKLSKTNIQKFLKKRAWGSKTKQGENSTKQNDENRRNAESK
ncbi:uncharacterized protein LOC116305504 [Actinia tenebrosa]|uniref:Uncharacterized protein LOC116305504 n=1 Tax=Actinia tenebrosa TaxID=6105 RepID=A0A6P8IW90_ACTTE|nr:uncharacterized protein LOC116305504 [Actinia tenebrosa]